MNSIIDSLNNSGANFIRIAAPMLIQSSLFIGFLFMIDFALRGRVRATVRYGIWMLALLKLVLPPSLHAPTAPAYWMAPATAAKMDFSRIAFESAAAASETPVAPVLPVHTPILSFDGKIFLAWISIAGVLGIYTMRRLHSMGQLIHGTMEAPDEIYALADECRRQLQIRAPLSIRVGRIASPAICGLWRPVILLPLEMLQKLDAAGLRAVLLHEMAHSKRGDLVVNHVQIILQILYWFNPLLWLANARIRQTREQAVDEMVLVAMKEQAASYPEILLQVARLALRPTPSSIGFLGILQPGRTLTERIIHIMNRPLPRSARMGAKGLAAMVLIGVAILPMACRQTSSTATVPATTEISLNINGDGSMVLQDRAVTLDDLKARLAEAAHNNPHTTLSIHAQSTVPWSLISKAIAAASGKIYVSSAVSTQPLPTDWSNKRTINPAMPPFLQEKDIAALEKKLADDPEDFSVRQDLIHYHRFRPMDRGQREKLVLWIIEHHPEFQTWESDFRLDPNMDALAYDEGKDLWLGHIKEQPTNTTILGNAVSYFTPYDLSRVEDLLKKAEALEPKNPRWPNSLGQSYKLGAMAGNDSKRAALSLAEFEKAKSLASPPSPGAPPLSDMAKIAVVAGQLDKAKDYANELLTSGRDDGDSFFNGNLVLGEVAVREGRIEEAEKYLLEAGKTKGSPVLGSFGPSMKLAKDLLDKGQTNSVIEFLKECQIFWKPGPGMDGPDKWIATIQQGGCPDFKANLVY